MNASDLLSEINVFLEKTGMSRSYFGRVATGNSELVARLEAGRTVTLTTAEAVRAFIAKRSTEPAAQSDQANSAA